MYLDSVNKHYTDPLKLIIIQAFRTEAIAGNITTLPQLIQKTMSRHDRTVQWAFPERPILCAYTSNGVLLINDPAQDVQVMTALNRAGSVCGISTRLRTHDIRRGTAAEVARLPPLWNLENATYLLDHRSRDRDLTRKYIDILKSI